jgi:predicted metal-dependent HD superfamily phosphohydrolase
VNLLDPERWARLWHAAVQQESPPGLFESLLARYAEPQRHYHNQRHLAECLREFDLARSLAREAVAVELALWFHDAVYDPHASDNEERSAELAVASLREAGAAATLVNAVQQLVLATKSHDGARHPDAPLLVDVDLSILGQPPQRFWEYEQAIRAEYAWVPQEHFAIKRAEILERFLTRPRLYHTEQFSQRFEAPARANLRAAIERLRSRV